MLFHLSGASFCADNRVHLSARCASPLRPIAVLPMADRSGAPPNGRAEVQEWRVSIPVIAAGSVAALNLTSTMLTLLML
jgi:hypothetical protein